MRSVKRFLIFTFLLIVVGVLNYLVRKKVLYSFGEVLSYNRTYSIKEQLRILHIARSGQDSLSIIFAGLSVKRRNHFEVFCDGTEVMDGWGPVLIMKPLGGLRIYRIKINSVDSLTMNIDFPRGNESVPEVTTSSLMIESADLPGYIDWIRDDFPLNTTGRVRQVDSYLRDSMKIGPADNSVEKVIKISKYILSVTDGKVGGPSDTMNGMRPIEQLNCVRAGRSLLYCGNYGYLFPFFSNRAGVPARYVECGATPDGVSLGGHVFNEVWLQEYGRWAYVDLTEGNVFVQKNHQFLNAVDVQRLLRYDDPDTGFTALHYRHDSLVSLPFREASIFAKHLLNSSNVFHFYYRDYSRLTSPSNLWERARNFLYPRPYYAIYSDNISPPDCDFFIRVFSNYLFFVGLLCWILWVIGYGIFRVFQK